jgi:hypothetical protein
MQTPFNVLVYVYYGLFRGLRSNARPANWHCRRRDFQCRWDFHRRSYVDRRWDFNSRGDFCSRRQNYSAYYIHRGSGNNGRGDFHNRCYF